jgi:hypothetical protein
MTSETSASATGSPGSGAGPSRSGSPAGRQLVLFGPDPAPASPSRRRGGARAPRTNGTSGPSSSGSSASADLSASLASRLKALLGTDGSMEYRQTWREKATPSGRQYWAHTASGRRISDSGCSGWPTPAVQNGEGGPLRDGRPGFFFTLQSAASLAGWPTPMVPNGGRTVEGTRTEEGREGRPQSGHLEAVALLAGWGTPSARDHKDAGPAFEGDPGIVPVESRLARQAALLAGWATPTARDHSRGDQPPRPHDTGVPLSQMAALASGTPSTSSPAGTGGRGASRALNPTFSGWLMGYGLAWEMCAPVQLKRRGKRS